VDLVDDPVTVYRDPSPDGYRTVAVARRGEFVSIQAMTGAAFAVDELLPPPGYRNLM
jgi:hypothetical protein